MEATCGRWRGTAATGRLFGEDFDVRHFRLQIDIIDVSVICLSKPAEMREELIGNEPLEFLTHFRASGIIKRISREPSMLDHAGSAGIITSMIVSPVKGMEHSVIGSYICDLSPSSPPLIKSLVTGVAVNQVKPFPRWPDDSRSRVDYISKAPGHQ